MADPVRGYIHRAPITTACIVVIGAMFVAVEIQVTRNAAQDSYKILKQWGRAPELVFLKPDGEPLPELSGPFDLWEGDWWRVPVSALHHGGTPYKNRLIHLLTSCLLIGYFGWWLEPLMPCWGFCSLIAITAVISMVPTYLMGETAIGMTGVGCALMMYLQQVWLHNEQLQSQFPGRLFLFGVASLLLVGIADTIGLLDVSVSVISVGAIYGAVAGFLFSKRRRWFKNSRAIFIFCHLLVLLGLSFTTKPYWDADYQWYRAIQETEVATKLEHLHESVERDPTQVHAWMMLSQLYYREGRMREAWRTSLETVDRHRSNEKAVKFTKELWKQFDSKRDRDRARSILADVFGDEAESWAARLALQDPPEDWMFFTPAETKPKTDAESYSLNQQILLPNEPTPPREAGDEKLLAPSVNPDDPQSAAEGVTL